MQSNNEIRLRAFMRFFGLAFSQVAKACHVSVPYISRVLPQNGSHISGSSGFWLNAERSLPQLVQERKTQIFSVAPVNVSRAEELRKSA